MSIFHRNAEYYTVKVVPSDYVGVPANSYLSRFTQPGATNSLVRCSVCPPGQAAYYWDDAGGAPMDVRLNVAAQACYPWFGHIPLMAPSQASAYGVDFNTTLVTHGGAHDNVLTPQQELAVYDQPCPVDTYSRECAHTKRWYYFQYIQYSVYERILPGSAATAAMYLAKYQCTPCPPGWHTNGTTGAWYCLPPLGQVLPAGVAPMTFLSSQDPYVPPWASRDLLQTEFECGYLPAHCQQCATYTQTPIPAGPAPAR